MKRRPEECAFTFTRTGDRGRLGEPVDVEACCLHRQCDHQIHESLVRRVGKLIYVSAIARCIVRCRVLGQGGYPTI